MRCSKACTPTGAQDAEAASTHHVELAPLQRALVRPQPAVCWRKLLLQPWRQLVELNSKLREVVACGINRRSAGAPHDFCVAAAAAVDAHALVPRALQPAHAGATFTVNVVHCRPPQTVGACASTCLQNTQKVKTPRVRVRHSSQGPCSRLFLSTGIGLT